MDHPRPQVLRPELPHPEAPRWQPSHGEQSRLTGMFTESGLDTNEHRPGCIDSYHDVPAYGLLQHAAEQLPEHTAVIYGEASWSYERLDRDAITAAVMLQRLGVKPGDRVGIALPNIPEFIIMANAIWRAGGVVVAISPLMVADEVSRLLKQTDCRLVVCLDMLSDTVHDPDVQLLLVSIHQHLPSLQRLGYFWLRHQRTGQWTLPSNGRTRWLSEELHLTSTPWRPVRIKPSADPAYILPTGGTTGVPKAVTLSHTNMVANAWQQSAWTRHSFGEEKMLAVLPFFHSYGMSATVMGGAAMAATLVLHHRFNTHQVIALLEKHCPTVFHAVPAMLVAMNQRYRVKPPKSRSLKWVISGGAPLEAPVAEEFSRHTGALVVEGYGLSEAAPVTHVGHLFKEAAYGLIGYPLPHTQVRIVDPDDGCSKTSASLENGAGLENGGSAANLKPCGEGEVGELIVRGPQVMMGYWNDPDATEQTLRGGWLHTGDLAIRDDQGRYQIVGRKKDLIITSGFNVYPSEVEDVLCGIDGVAEAAVIGVPDPNRGEAVKAVVVMKPGSTFEENSLRKYCESALSKYKRPRIYEHRQTALPRNFLGKLIRRELRPNPADANPADARLEVPTTEPQETDR